MVSQISGNKLILRHLDYVGSHPTATKELSGVSVAFGTDGITFTRRTDELGELGVDVDRTWVDDVFREAMLGVVSMAILSGATAEVENERGEQLVAALVERAFQSAFDVDAAEFLP